MKIFKVNILIISLLSIVLFGRCVSDTINLDDVSDEANREYSLDIPGLTLRGSITDLFEEFNMDTLLIADEDGLYWYNYNTTSTYDWQSLFTLDSPSGDFEYDFSDFGIVGIPGINIDNVEIDNSEEIVISQDEDLKLDSLFLDGGELNLTFESTSDLIQSIELTIPQLFINDEVYTTFISSSSLSEGVSIDLEGAMFDFTAGESSNTINIETTVTISGDAGELSNASLKASYSLDLDLSKAYGYFGSRVVVDEDESFAFGAFDEENLGTTLSLADMQIEVIGQNTYGAQLHGEVSSVVFSNTNTGVDKLLTMDEGVGEINIDAYNVGDTEIPADTFELNSSNSSLEDFLTLDDSFVPNQISSHVQVTINPDDDESQNFVTDTSTIKTTINLNIPLWFKADTYSRLDTIDFNFNEDIDDNDDEDDTSLSDQISSMTINFDVDNRLPFEMSMQLYFADENYVYVDSLFASEDKLAHVDAATLDDDGNIEESTASSFSVEVDSDMLDLWSEKDVKYILFKTTGATGGDDYVKVKTDNYIDITLSFSVTGKLNE